MTALVARGWATVELDRAARDLAGELAHGESFRDAPRSPTLGARCRVGRTGDPACPFVVLLEPDTEGRLAAYLARHDEGWAVTWTAGRPDEPTRTGPLGAETLVLDRSPEATFRFVVAAATIDR